MEDFLQQTTIKNKMLSTAQQSQKENMQEFIHMLQQCPQQDCQEIIL